MLLICFSFYDSKAQFFEPPFFMHHPGQAVRTAMDLAGDPNTRIGRYPEDYHLYEIGTFDDQTGTLTRTEPHSLGPCSSFSGRRPAARPEGSTDAP